jgi:translation initiation factor 2 alpha subunit (eIF-2alpha)
LLNFNTLILDRNPEAPTFKELKIHDEVRKELSAEIQRRLKPKPVDIKAIFDITTYSYNGI